MRFEGFNTNFESKFGVNLWRRSMLSDELLHQVQGGSAHTLNLLFEKDPGNLRDARNSLSPVVNHHVLDECTNVCSLDLYIVSLVAYMCIL